MSKEIAKADKFTEFVPFGAQDKIKLSIEMVKNLIAVKTKTGRTCSDTDAIKFIAMCSARRLNPFEGDAFLIGYDSKDGATYSLITAHQAFLKRAELHPEYNGMKSGVIVKRKDQVLDLEGDFYMDGDEVLGGWAIVHFKTRQHPMSKRIRLKRFQKAFGIWLEDPAGMIVKCAEADALRSSFPTMLGGLYLKEETEHLDTRVSAPIFKSNPATAQVEDKPELEVTPIAKLLELMKMDGVELPVLLQFLKDVAIAEDEIIALSELEEETLQMIIDRWDDFVQKIKEAWFLDKGATAKKGQNK